MDYLKKGPGEMGRGPVGQSLELFLLSSVLRHRLGPVIDFSDSMILALVFPNMVGLMLLFPKVRQELWAYLKPQRNNCC